MLLQSTVCCTLMILAAAAAAGKAQHAPPTPAASPARYMHSSLSLGGTLQAHARLADAITTGSTRKLDSTGPHEIPLQHPAAGDGSGSGSGDKGSMGGSQRLSQSYVSSKSGSGVVQCTFKVRFLPSEWIRTGQLDLGSGGSGGILAI